MPKEPTKDCEHSMTNDEKKAAEALRAAEDEMRRDEKNGPADVLEAYVWKHVGMAIKQARSEERNKALEEALEAVEKVAKENGCGVQCCGQDALDELRSLITKEEGKV